MKILFVLKHPGDVRLLGSVLAALDERGHQSHLAFQGIKTSESRVELDRLTQGARALTFGKAPATGSSRWNHLADALRLAIDYLRYLEPLYADTPKLRENAEAQVSPAVRKLGRLAALVGSPGVKSLRRTLQALEHCIPPSERVVRFVEEHRPDVFLVSPLVAFGSRQADYLRAAKRLGIRTGYVLESWDNLTTKGLMRDVPDLALVWNEIQADEAVELHGVPRDRVRVAGAWAWDHWFEWRPERTRAEFCTEVGLRPDRPVVLYVGSSWWVIEDEVDFVRRWVTAVRARGGVLADVGIVVRPHPNRRDTDWQTAELGDPQIAVWPRRGAEPLSARTRQDYFDSIHHSAAVFGINTSAQIEAAIVGRPVLTLVSEEFRRTQQGTIHFHYLKDEFGHLHVAGTLDEHAAQLEAVLGGITDDGRTERFVRRFARPFGLDTPATPRVVEAIEELGRQPAPSPGREPRHAPLVRRAMIPLAILATRGAARRHAAKPRSPERKLRHLVRQLAREEPGRRVLAGPWLGDEIGELLYWIPFLRWAQTATFGFRERLWIAARPASRQWYEGVGAKVLDPDEADEDGDFQRLRSEQVEAVRAELARHEPAARIQVRLLEFAPLATPPLPSGLPDEYVAVDAGVDERLLDRLGDQLPLVTVEADDMAVIGHASGFVGPYGPRVFIAALLGVPAVGLYARAEEVSADDLRLARAFLGRPPFGGVHPVQLGDPDETLEQVTRYLRGAAGALVA